MSAHVQLIGIFDSGIGGLTVFKELRAKLPKMDIIYLGDTARVPYGTKSPETVIRYSNEAAKFLIRSGVDLIVVACNTSSALAIEPLRKHFDIPIVGVIEAGARRACGITRTKRIGIIGTQATVKSGAYQHEIRKILPDAKVNSLACPLFVPLAEEGWTDNTIAHDIASIYLNEMKREEIDVLILGCTHYPLLKRTIADVMGNEVMLVDSAESVAEDVKEMFSGERVTAKGGKIDEKSGMDAPEHRFYVTDSTERFREVGSRFLEYEINDPMIVDITCE